MHREATDVLFKPVDGSGAKVAWDARREYCYSPVYALAAVLDPRYMSMVKQVDDQDFLNGLDLLKPILGTARATGVSSMIRAWKRDPSGTLGRPELLQVYMLVAFAFANKVCHVFGGSRCCGECTCAAVAVIASL